MNTKFILYFQLLLVFAIAFSCSKQQEKAKNERINHSDSLLLSNLLDTINRNYPQNNDSLILLSERIIAKFPLHKAHVNEKIAYLHFTHSNYILAEHFFHASSRYYFSDSLKENYADQIGNIGVINELSGNYPQAISNYLKALSIFDSLNKEIKCSKIYNNIGIVYQQINEPEKALFYFKKSLDITQKIGKKQLSANRFNNIATIYEDYLNNLDSAIYYYNKSLEIYKIDSTDINLPIVINNIGFVYLKKEKLENADSLFSRALFLCISQNRRNNIAPILRNIATLQIKKKKFSEAIITGKEAVKIAKNNTNIEIELESLSVIEKAYEGLGDFFKATIALKEYHSLKEKISGENQKNEINKLNIQFDVKEKENRITILELENNVQQRKLRQLWLSILLLIILLLGFYIFYRLQKKNNQLEMDQMQRDIQDYISQIEEMNDSKFEKDTDNEKSFILESINKFDLSDREKEVLFLISQGYKNAEIGEKLFISLNTVKTHTKNIFSKLDVRNRIEAVKKTQIIP